MAGPRRWDQFDCGGHRGCSSSDFDVVASRCRLIRTRSTTCGFGPDVPVSGHQAPDAYMPGRCFDSSASNAASRYHRCEFEGLLPKASQHRAQKHGIPL
jgi:hypothetical protein